MPFPCGRPGIRCPVLRLRRLRVPGLRRREQSREIAFLADGDRLARTAPCMRLIISTMASVAMINRRAFKLDLLIQYLKYYCLLIGTGVRRTA